MTKSDLIYFYSFSLIVIWGIVSAFKFLIFDL